VAVRSSETSGNFYRTSLKRVVFMYTVAIGKKFIFSDYALLVLNYQFRFCCVPFILFSVILCHEYGNVTNECLFG
jgi:predicted nucleic acid-binding Zn finger protein